jgi:hypothetical protein
VEHNNDLMAQLVQQLTTMLQLIIVGGVMGAVATLASTFSAWMSRRNAAAIAGCTDVTIKKGDEALEKLDSATKDIRHDAIQTAKAGVVIAQQAASTNRELLKQQLAPLTEKLNGGPGGLEDLTARVAKLETKYDLIADGQKTMSKGQSEMAETLIHISELLDRKLV